MFKECNLVELFSGIGSQARALNNLGIEVHTVGTSEWDVHAIAAYDVIHNSAEIPENIQLMSKEEILDILKKYTFSNSGKAPLSFSSLRTYSAEALKRIYASISRNNNFVDVSMLNGADLPDGIDILTYSFPCQDLSNVGAFHGYNKGIDKDSGSRSSLLWQVGRILTEMHTTGRQLPRYLLMENVPTLLSDRHFSNFSTWINDLSELGYTSKYYQLNASFFGLPQNRPRLLMISVYTGNNAEERHLVEDYFDLKSQEDIISDYCSSEYYVPRTVSDLLRINYENKKIFEEAVECTPNDTVSRRKIWDDNPQIILPDGSINTAIDAIRTITTKQDRNPNSGNLYFDSGIEGRSKFRYLTPRECLLFMGFTDEDYKNLKKHNVEFHKGDAFFARDKIIRMSGNSIPVKLLEGIFLQIIQIDEILNDYRKCAFHYIGGCSEKRKTVKRITRYLFSRNIRCRKPGDQYPASPDMIFPAYRTAVFVHDCLQHSHNCTTGKMPEKNRLFWEQRIKEATDNDNSEYDTLRSNGWNVIVLWKCELTDSKIDGTLKRLESQIRRNKK